MANVKFNVPVDEDDLTFSNFSGAEIGAHNKKSFELTTDSGVTIDVEGSGFKYGKVGGELIVKSGDIDSIEVKLGEDLPVFSLRDIDVSVEKLFEVAATATLADDYKLLKQVFAGKDNFEGSGGDDALFSFGGADALAGGKGNDVLDGGKGNDKFVFAEAGTADADRIVSFGGKDEIQLSSSFFSELTTDAGGIAKGTFVLGAAAVDANDHLIYDKSTGHLFYDPDGAGGQAQMLIATLDRKFGLGRDDFDLV